MKFSLRIAISAIAVATLIVATQTRAALVGYWTLDNDTTGLQNLGTDGATSDLIAPAANATVTGGPTFTATGGHLGGFATFDGNQALLANTVGNAADDLLDYPFTLAAWIRPSLSHPAALRGAAIGISQASAGSTYYTVGYEANNSSVESNDAQAVRRNTTFTSTEGTNTAASLFDGNWHHVAVVNSSATDSVLYLDGALVGTSATSVTFSANVNTITIGAFLRNNTAYTDKFYGDIDEPRIYDTALSAADIQALVPEPGSLCLGLWAALCMRGLTRKKA